MKSTYSMWLLLLMAAQSNAQTDAAQTEFLGKVRAEVAELTHRRAEGLAPQRSDDGSSTVDLRGGMQHVQLVKIENGDFVHACADHPEQAERFFSRPSPAKAAYSSDEKRAALHGMSVADFDRYSRMIETAKNAKLAATFTIVNNDGAGEGFNDATAVSAEGGNNGTTRGQQRLNLFAEAGRIWGTELDSTIAIRIASQFNPQTCSTSGAVLGSAGALSVSQNFTNAPFTNTFFPVALANKLRGFDGSASDDISATFNSDIDNGCLGAGSRWYYGFDNSTPANRINLLVVLLHEFGHGLGFQTFTNTSTGALFNGANDHWTRFMRDASIGGGTAWSAMSDAQRQSSAIGGNLFWDGPSVKIASSGMNAAVRDSEGRLRLFAPSPLQPGSSVSHYDSQATPNLLMEPAINAGLPLTLDLSRQLMRDIGWKRDTDGNVTPDTITAVAPASGTVLVGASVTIAWTNNGGFNKPVAIDLSTDGGLTFPTVISASVTNTSSNGSFSWTVPNVSTTQARIRVREVGYVDPAGISSANFVISSNSPPSASFSATPSAQAGSPLGSPVTIGTVSDAQTAAGSLTVAANPPTNITVSNITNSSGSIGARFQAACAANTGSANVNATVPFTVTDAGAASTTANVTLTVTPNSAPVLTYPTSASVNFGSTATVTATALSDNGTVTNVAVLSQGTFAGTVIASINGQISISNAQPAGSHTITIRATDNCNVSTDRTFTLAVNGAPSFSAASITRQRGSNATNANLGTVTDDSTAAGSITASLASAASGLSVSSLSNTNGALAALVGTTCAASLGTNAINLNFVDGSGATSSGVANVIVTDNTAPVLAYSNQALAIGSSATVTPATALSDNGTISSISVQSTGSFTGSALVNSQGNVTLSNAGPSGDHVITVRVIDNCNASSDVALNVRVNAPPSFTAASGITLQSGTAASVRVLGTIADDFTQASSVTATVGTLGTGIALSALNNSSGQLSGLLGAACNAPAGSSSAAVALNDGSLSSTTTVALSVTANSPPSLTYAAATIAPGASTTLFPTVASDNGTFSVAVQSLGTFTGTANAAANGAVTISNAGPTGVHTLTLRSTDNCNLTSDASLVITVSSSNTAPTFAAGANVTLTQGSVISAPISLGTIADGQSAASTLTVTPLTSGSASNISVTDLSNTNGNVSARFTPACNAAPGSYQFQVSDGVLNTTASVTVAINPNTPPLLSAYPASQVPTGQSATINPASAPSDNGAVTALSASAAAFTGSFSASNTSGAVSVTNAGPVGTFVVTVTGTDNCGATSTTGFNLTVDPDAVFRNGFEDALNILR